MKLVLTTKQVLEYYEALTRLDGYQRTVEVNGRNQIVTESYDLSAEFKWNAAKNKNLLREIKDRFEEQREIAAARIRSMAVAFAPPAGADEKATDEAFSQHRSEVQKAEFEENAKLAELGLQKNEISGLLKLPGDGIKIRSRDPGLIAILDVLMTDFIEGEPDFGDRKKDE